MQLRLMAQVMLYHKEGLAPYLTRKESGMLHQDAYVKEDRLNADCLNEAFLWLFKGIDWGVTTRFVCSIEVTGDCCSMLYD